MESNNKSTNAPDLPKDCALEMNEGANRPLWDPTTGEVCSAALLNLARDIEEPPRQVPPQVQPRAGTSSIESNNLNQGLSTNEKEQHIPRKSSASKPSQSFKEGHQAERHMRYLSLLIEMERREYRKENIACKELRHKILEEETRLGVDIDSLKLAQLRQSRVFRCLQNPSFHHVLFSDMEHEIKLLERNIQRTRAEQAKAVDARFEQLLRGVEGDQAASVGIGTLQLMKREVQSLIADRKRLNNQMYDISKRSREDIKLRLELSRIDRGVQEQNKGDLQLQKDLERQSLTCAALEVELREKQLLIRELEDTNKMLQQRVTSVEKEAQELELYAAQIHREQVQNKVLDRFVKKHTQTDPSQSEAIQAKDRIQKLAGDARRSLYVLETAPRAEGMTPIISRLRGALDDLVLRSLKAISTEQDTAAALLNYVDKT